MFSVVYFVRRVGCTNHVFRRNPHTNSTVNEHKLFKMALLLRMGTGVSACKEIQF